MPAGRLNKRCTFQSATLVDDGGGGSSTTWVDGVTVWGGLVVERGRERVEAGRLVGDTGGLLIVRSSSVTKAIGLDTRVSIDGEIWNIRSNENEDQHDKFRSMVVEKGVAT